MNDQLRTIAEGHFPPEMPIQRGIVLSTSQEKKGVFNALEGCLIIGTTQEVNGLFRKEEVAENNTLRGVVKKLAVDLGIDKIYRAVDWLSIGIYDYIPDDLLNDWANSTEDIYYKDEGFHKRRNTARYLLKKKRTETQRDK